MAKRQALGRGLGAFFPDVEKKGPKKKTDEVTETESTKEVKAEKSSKPSVPSVPEPKIRVNTVASIPPANITANPYQPRTDFKEEELEELANSIAEFGLIQPITVRYLGGEKFELISGERRLRAAKLCGLQKVPAYIIDADTEGLMAMALIENIQRSDLNPIEVALGYRRLIEECEYTQEELAKRVGKNRSTVTNMMRLLNLPALIQSALRDERISMGHARALLAVEDSRKQEQLLHQILNLGLSVRQTEAAVRNLSDKSNSRKKVPTSADPFIRAVSDRLRDNLSTKVEIKQKKKGGEIRIEYYSNDDLERLLDILEK